MIVQIPTKPVANQQLQIVLNGQQCTINLYQRTYIDYSNDELIEELNVSNAVGYQEPLCIDSDNRDDVLLVNAPNPNPLQGIWDRMYLDLYVSGVQIFAGLPVVYGSVINQYVSPLFTGYLFINTADGLDPIYTDLGSTTTLNYTDNGAA